ncbi:MAG: pyruvate, phosphate dikinase, partial [Alphaproteobacteria bacterium]|nr:pyruvate, phosphate dikinase [Alphaproteobacteria bacterium]
VGATLGDPENPLIVSVRSGAPNSMPGMMDTILNLGLNDACAEGLAQQTGDGRFAFDCYRRFITQYSELAMGADLELFDDAVAKLRGGSGLSGSEFSEAELRSLATAFQAVVTDELATDFPQDPRSQLWGAIRAVVDSWGHGRAARYRAMHDIGDTPGTAVTVQAMVFGNRGTGSATGVGFTRDPSTGANRPFGEFLANAQGEDIVSGVSTPHGLSAGQGNSESLEDTMPEVFAALIDSFGILERHLRWVQEVEFTVEQGRLWVLQTRNAVPSLRAAAQIAVDMVRVGILDRDEALGRVDAAALGRLLHPEVDPAAEKTILARGIPASPGAATGLVVFTSDDAVAMQSAGQTPILVRPETKPEDVHGIAASVAVLTSRGGATSHAAVVARSMGRPCVTGASEVDVDAVAKTFTVGDQVVRAGDILTVDGTNGVICLGAVPLRPPEPGDAITEFLSWTD